MTFWQIAEVKIRDPNTNESFDAVTHGFEHACLKGLSRQLFELDGAGRRAKQRPKENSKGTSQEDNAVS